MGHFRPKHDALDINMTPLLEFFWILHKGKSQEATHPGQWGHFGPNK